MNRTIFPRSVASWIFCAVLAGLSPSGLGQLTLPPLLPVGVPNFTIPFEIGGPADAIREVELFVSKDRGRRWDIVARQPVETGKFAFRADSDGEYWFAFRSVTPNGTTGSLTGHPELRVLVDTKNPVAFQPSESGPVVPPKPERFRPGGTPKPQPQQTELTKTDEPKAEEPVATKPEPQAKPNTTLANINVESPAQILAPKFPGFDLPEPTTNREGDLLDDLLNGMSSFMDIQSTAARNTSGNQVAAAKPNPVSNVASVPNSPSPSVDAPAGSITRIDLNNTDTRPQIVVRWGTGNELWRDAQVDVLRSGTPEEGQWSPIAINLPNSGEYWWYLSPEDLKPFYIAVRIRSLSGGSSVSVTQKKIEIDPRLAVFQSRRP